MLEKAEQICTIWKNRSLSLIGKVTVLNTLVGSLFVYKMAVLQSISQDEIKKFEKTVNDFLWGTDKRPKIALRTLQNTKEYGGLKVIDIAAKDKALKIQWINKFKNNDKIRTLALQFLPLGEQYWYCNLNSKDIKKVVESGFWQDVALAWAKINFRKPERKEHVLEQRVWYNSEIKVGGKVIFYKKVFEAGLVTIRQLLNDTGTGLCSFQDFQTRFGVEGVSWLEFNSLIAAIPTEWKNMLSHNYHDPNYKSNYDALKPKSSQNIYIRLVEDEKALCKVKSRWEEKLNATIEQEEFEKLFLNLYKITTNSKLRSFQFRLLHRRIYLNQQLYRWKMTDSALCDYCQEEYETIEHLFTACRITQRFWELLQNWYECMTNTEINFSITDTLFNNTENLTINAILISAKQFIFSRKIQGKYINFYIFKDQLREQIKYEHKLTKERNSKMGWKKFNKKWGSIIRI